MMPLTWELVWTTAEARAFQVLDTCQDLKMADRWMDGSNDPGYLRSLQRNQQNQSRPNHVHHPRRVMLRVEQLSKDRIGLRTRLCLKIHREEIAQTLVAVTAGIDMRVARPLSMCPVLPMFRCAHMRHSRPPKEPGRHPGLQRSKVPKSRAAARTNAMVSSPMNRGGSGDGFVCATGCSKVIWLLISFGKMQSNFPRVSKEP